MVTQSPMLDALGGALAKAQAKMKGAIRESANPFFKSRYADLASVWDACREALTLHGLSVLQSPAVEGDLVTVTTLLLHESGQFVSGIISARPAKSDIQGIGSAITYLRRYALSAMVGIAPEDDDGEAAVGRKFNGKYNEMPSEVGQILKERKPEKPAPTAAQMSDEQGLAQKASDIVKARIAAGNELQHLAQLKGWNGAEKMAEGKLIALNCLHGKKEPETLQDWLDFGGTVRLQVEKAQKELAEDLKI